MRSVPGHRPPGRALLGQDALECQLALPPPLRPLPGPLSGSAHPLRIPDLPVDPVLHITQNHPQESCHAAFLPLPIGPGGDDGDVLEVDLLRAGGLLVTGPPGSGRSAALDAFGVHLVALGVPVLRLGGAPRRGPEDAAVVWLDPRDESGTADWIGELAGSTGVVIADDLGSPSDTPALGRLPALGARGGVALLAAAVPGQLSGHFQGPVAALRRSRTGLLLCPGPGDADVLGIRLPRTPLPVRAGSGWLVTGGGPQRVQVARHRRAVPARTGPR